MLALAVPAFGGPPYQTDDPEPTEYRHFEIYFFAGGTATRSGSGQLAGIDLNYGVAPEFQLDVVVPAGFGDAGAVLPVGFGNAEQGQNAVSLGNVQLALKYRFLHQRDIGLDVAFYPRVFLPAGPNAAGESVPSLFLPIWLEKDLDAWSIFGGGGYQIDRGGNYQDSYQLGLAVTREVLPHLQIGAEVYYQSPNTRGGLATAEIDGGFIYDLSDNFHLMASAGPGIENANETDRYSWYGALLVTF
jgi:Putative MetA-pathway of phenol degradation